ncbi:hypothetical protein AM587_10000091 [Phytophthora nicotianae]|uniref:Uncharacterized protein n=1 Tax=Phytophthora nicotianae TaxID=4792 RepID=A0A0W8DWL3_PHYNI|nr:hypothetical protein AM587_10000091 [Phytophthora nicotianae]
MYSQCVTTECLLNMAIGFEPEFVSGRMKKAGIMYVHRFCRRYRLSIWRITHRGTNKRIGMSVKFAAVFNMHQTTAYIDMGLNMIDFEGAKHVDVVLG